MKRAPNHLEPLLSVPRMTRTEERRTAFLMRRMYRKARQLERKIGKRGFPQRFLSAAIEIAKRRGDAARDQLLLSHMRLITMLAWRHLYGPKSLTVEELVCEGYFAVLKALPTHNPRKGRVTTFIWTSASWRMFLVTGRGKTTQKLAEEIKLYRHGELPEEAPNAKAVEPGKAMEAMEEEVDRQYRLRFVNECVNHLPESPRAVIRGRYYATEKRSGNWSRSLEDQGLEMIRRHMKEPNPDWQRRGCSSVIPGDEFRYEYRTPPSEAPGGARLTFRTFSV